MLGRHTPPAPLERGGLGWCFLVGNGDVVWGGSGAAFLLVVRVLYGNIRVVWAR